MAAFGVMTDATVFVDEDDLMIEAKAVEAVGISEGCQVVAP